MKSPFHKRYTVDNNINTTHNILCAIVESGLDVHMVHLGTMGVYGYGTAGMAVPEGYLPVRVDTPSGEAAIEIPYPPNPGSIYHMTKTLDALLFFYYNKNDSVRDGPAPGHRVGHEYGRNGVAPCARQPL